jgi:PKD repeat protein
MAGTTLDKVTSLGLGTPNNLLNSSFVGGSAPAPNQAPTANFTSSCATLTCSFIDSSFDSDGAIATRSWAFGDGATSSAVSPAHSFDSPGSYIVSLTVTDNLGAQATKTRTITVDAPVGVDLPPSVAPVGDMTVKEGEQLTFPLVAVDPEGAGLTYSAVNLPAGATFEVGSHTFSWTPSHDQAGTYPGIQLRVSDGALSAQVDFQVTVLNAAIPTATRLRGVKVKKQRIAVNGMLTAPSPRTSVTVELLKKRGSGYVRISTRRVQVDATGAFSTSLARPRHGGLYRVAARFLGDGERDASETFRTFRLP